MLQVRLGPTATPRAPVASGQLPLEIGAWLGVTSKWKVRRRNRRERQFSQLPRNSRSHGHDSLRLGLMGTPLEGILAGASPCPIPGCDGSPASRLPATDSLTTRPARPSPARLPAWLCSLPANFHHESAPQIP